jgi:hypothetical protein
MRHVAVIRTLEFEVENAPVGEQQNQVGPPFLHQRKLRVQKLAYRYAARQLIQQTRP